MTARARAPRAIAAIEGASPALSSTSSPSAFFDDPTRIAIILGTFFFITLPLSILPSLFAWGEWMALGFWVLVGATHFFLPLFLYLRRDNLRYFRASRRNVLIYLVIAPIIFAIPCLLDAFYPRPGPYVYDLGLFATPGVLTPGAYPALFVLVWSVGARGFDFYHTNMQSFGMLELLKRTSGKYSIWLRRCNRAFFLTIACLLLITFLNGGRFDPTNPAVIAGAILAAALFLVNTTSLLLGWQRSGRRPRGWTAAVYFAFQGISMSLAIWRFELYLAALAMHFVEYHLLMRHRVFAGTPDARAWPDRVLAWLKTYRAIFYLLLIIPAAYVVFWAEVMDDMKVSPTVPMRLLTNILNGIFLFHYFVEAFIWKFSDPYWRSSLAPLFLGQPSAAPLRAIEAQRR